MPNAPKARRVESLPILNAVMQVYEINNERRVAAWLATLAVESGELKYQQEIASGAAYEGREDLGNTEPGDGKRFKGHGRIQITGRDNHTAYTRYLKANKHLPFVDFVKHPQRLAEEPYATDSAGWFWAVYKKLNPLADARQFLKTQVRVNGRNRKTGLPNHWEVRKNYYERALRVLPDDFLLEGAEPVEDVEESDIDLTEPLVTDSVTDDSPKPSQEEVKPEIKSQEPEPPAAPQADKPKVTPIEAPPTSITTKVAATAGAIGPVIAATGLKIGGVEFKTGGIIAFAAVVIVGMVVAAWIWNQSQERRERRQRLSMENLASDSKGNVIAAGSKV